MKKLRVAGITILAVIVFGAGTLTGIEIDRHYGSNVEVSRESKIDFQLINQAWGLIQSKYVDQSVTHAQQLAYGAIDGMVNSLGDTGHSIFLTPQEVQLEKDAQQGQLQGIGAEVQEKNGSVVIVAPIDGSPAQKAGLRSGDIILAVDNIPVSSVTDAVTRIRGPAGTAVAITFQNTDGITSTISIVRAKINLVSVTWNLLPGTSIAHLHISSFDTDVTTELV